MLKEVFSHLLAFTFQKVGLILYETTPTTVELTDVGTGVDGSGAVVGGLFIRTAVVGSTSALTFKNADVCSSVENCYDNGGYTLYLVQRAAVTNILQVEYTGDADTDVDVCWYAKYEPMSAGSALLAV